MSNQALLMERFPRLGLLSGAWGSKRPCLELLRESPLNDTQALYVYGIGTGAVYNQVAEWLAKDESRRLIFLEDDPDLLGGFLQEEPAAKILADRQVDIALVESDGDLDGVAEKFPFTKIEVVALPSRRGSRFNRLRLKLLRKTTLTQSLHLDRAQGDGLFRNFVQNVNHLGRSFYANALKNAFQGIPAIVCGAGPSLETDLLRVLQESALLIGGGSTIAALTSQGIVPHFGMAFDPNPEEGIRFQNVAAPNMPLLYSTRLFPPVLEKHTGPIGYMRSGIGGVPELWMEEQLGLDGPLLSALVSSESISVTTICVAWAHFLGCNPILFNGLDLAYTDHKRYAPGVIAESAHPSQSAADQLLRRKTRSGKWVTTAVRWVMESESFSFFAKQCKETRFINTTKGGIGFRGIEFIPLEQISFQEVPCNLRAWVEEKIAQAPRLSTVDLKELQESLKRTVGHLRILAGEAVGSTALAEVELGEELAVSILFYDTPRDNWKSFLALAVRHDLVFMELISERSNTNA